LSNHFEEKSSFLILVGVVKLKRYPNGTDSQHFSFLSKISVETIAKQISLMELSMVQSIYPSSLLKNKESAASITTYYEHFEGVLIFFSF
jgi:hypothetical protein